MAKRVTIVGGGPGGYVAAIRAAQLGARVHLVEQDALGGTCLNVGCIPTKAFLHVAEMYQGLVKGKTVGIQADNLRVDWPAVLRYQRSVVRRLVNGVGGLLKANGVQVQRGHAVLKSPQLVEVDGTGIEADAVILAVGSEPARLVFPGCDLPGIIDSTAALSLEEIPRSMVIVGGGVIGVEFAAMFSAFGSSVTVVEMLPQILPGIDAEIAARVHDQLIRQGVTIVTSARLAEAGKQDAHLLAILDVAGRRTEVPADKVLVAVGRRPRTAGMGLEGVGVAMERGRILVDEHFMTNLPHLYAVGDCSSPIMLAHLASAQGIAAVEHVLGHKPAYFGHIVPSCIYTSPEIATVGLTEEEARARGLEVRTGVFSLSGNGKALIESEGMGMIKIVSGARHKEILGVHIWGPRATDLIAEAALAMRLEATVDELISTIHAHPTIGEAMAEAALATDGMAIHWPPPVGG